MCEPVAHVAPITPRSPYWHNKANIDAYPQRVEALAETEYQEWAKNPSPLIQRLRAARAERARGEQRSA